MSAVEKEEQNKICAVEREKRGQISAVEKKKRGEISAMEVSGGGFRIQGLTFLALGSRVWRPFQGLHHSGL